VFEVKARVEVIKSEVESRGGVGAGRGTVEQKVGAAVGRALSK